MSLLDNGLQDTNNATRYFSKQPYSLYFSQISRLSKIPGWAWDNKLYI